MLASLSAGGRRPRPAGLSTRLYLRGRGTHLRLQVVLQSYLVDQVELDLQPVDVLLGVIENAFEQLARNVIGRLFATRDRGFDRAVSPALKTQIDAQHFRHVFADRNLAKV